MNDFTMRTLIETKGQQETHYLQTVDRLANAVKEDRDAIAAFLEDHPEMEEFLSGDIENGYTYVPGKPENPIPEPIFTIGLECHPPMENGAKTEIGYAVTMPSEPE